MSRQPSPVDRDLARFGHFSRAAHGGLIAFLGSPDAGAWTPLFELGALHGSVLPRALWAKAIVLGIGGVAIGCCARLAVRLAAGSTAASLARWS